MTIPRPGPYVHVSWLSKLMAGDVQCQWSPWFRTHYYQYPKAPSDFDRATWQIDHNRLLTELTTERQALGERVARERQNNFTVPVTKGGVVLAGQPDLVAVDQGGAVTVYDAKTGTPRTSDVIQVTLYLACLPRAFSQYQDATIRGCVVYRDGQRTEIPADAVDAAFKERVGFFLDIVESDVPPARAPSPPECRFCDITAADCPERLEWTGESHGAAEGSAALDW